MLVDSSRDSARPIGGCSLSRSIGASELQTLIYIRIPAAIHFIFSGLKISAVFAVTVVIVTVVGSNAGLGY